MFVLHSCGDEARRAALPDTTGFPGELLAQRVHSINYDQSWSRQRIGFCDDHIFYLPGFFY